MRSIFISFWKPISREVLSLSKPSFHISKPRPINQSEKKWQCAMRTRQRNASERIGNVCQLYFGLPCTRQLFICAELLDAYKTKVFTSSLLQLARLASLWPCNNSEMENRIMCTLNFYKLNTSHVPNLRRVESTKKFQGPPPSHFQFYYELWPWNCWNRWKYFKLFLNLQVLLSGLYYPPTVFLPRSSSILNWNFLASWTITLLKFL